jgi:hypothetical protein
MAHGHMPAVEGAHGDVDSNRGEFCAGARRHQSMPSRFSMPRQRSLSRPGLPLRATSRPLGRPSLSDASMCGLGHGMAYKPLMQAAEASAMDSGSGGPGSQTFVFGAMGQPSLRELTALEAEACALAAYDWKRHAAHDTWYQHCKSDSAFAQSAVLCVLLRGASCAVLQLTRGGVQMRPMARPGHQCRIGQQQGTCGVMTADV